MIDFYLCTIDGATLLDAAKATQAHDDESPIRAARFYMAEDTLLRHRSDATCCSTSLKACPRNFREYDGAQAELRALGALLLALEADTATAPASEAP